MVSTSGSQLLPQNAVRELREDLLPHATILTPNVPEAKLLLFDAGEPVSDPKDVEDLISIAKAVQSLGPRYVLLKGGHLPLKGDGSVAQTEDERQLMVDILYGDGKVTKIETAYVKSKNTHGTGCSLACKCMLRTIQYSAYASSCHRLESCKWSRDDRSSEACLSLRRGGHQNID